MAEWQQITLAELRSWPMDDRGWYVYRLWDRDDECLYIGSTGWLRKRIHGHRARAHWPLVLIGGADVSRYPDRAAARAAERYWIGRLGPVFNRSRPRGERTATIA